MFIAGDGETAKATVFGLARDIGFEPIDAGPLARARVLEPLALLWISLAVFQGQGTHFALQLVRKPTV
jgi:predicted dinucleotide-binding enzyme